MLTQSFRQILRSPLPPLAAACRQFWRHGARIRRARLLCQCADGLRLRGVSGWEPRSARLYRKIRRTLGELAGPEESPTDDAGRAAHRALSQATAPYRAALAAALRSAGLLAALALVALAATATVSSGVRARLFPRDLAAGRPWTASNADFNMPGSGNGPESATATGVFFHTAQVKDPWVEIDLGDEHVIRRVRVENRPDCCQERALPLNVEILEGNNTWRLIFQRRTAFSVWSEDIGPVRARRIRFFRPGTDYFHLKRIQVFGQ
jgi:hypothetical protein